MTQVQIMGQNIDQAFKAFHVDAEKLIETPDQHFQVWELDEAEMDRINDLDVIADEEWDKYYGCWWRQCESIYTGSETIDFNVNGKKMRGYINIDISHYSPSETIDRSSYSYVSYMDWLYEVMNLSNDSNTVAVATSLAIDNSMTLAKFIETYQN
jgi:hypothetical protein